LLSTFCWNRPMLLALSSSLCSFRRSKAHRDDLAAVLDDSTLKSTTWIPQLH
jgi:hypothetical protein